MAKLQIGSGMHTSSTCACNGINDDFLKPLAEAGHKIAAKCVDGTSGMVDFQRLINNGAEGIGVYRVLQGYDVPNYGQPIAPQVVNYINRLNEEWPPELDKELFYVELINEVDKNEADWIGWFMCELAQAAMDNGYRFCGPAWNTGEPEKEHWETPGMLAYLRMCEQHPKDLAIAVHEYAFNYDMLDTKVHPWQMGRVALLNMVCFENSITLPDVFVTEFGWSYNDAPNTASGISQIIRMYEWYLENAPNVKATFLWCLDRSDAYEDLPDKINSYMKPLANAIIAKDWAEPSIPDFPDPVEKPKIVIMKLAQGHTKSTWGIASQYAHDFYKRTMTASHDDMLTMLGAGNKESYAIVVDPERPSQKESLALLKAAGFNYVVYYIEDSEPKPFVDLFKFRPCQTELVTQVFGANPDRYSQWGLPGHDGIDYGVGQGQAYHAVQSGVVVHASDQKPNGGPSAYGFHVIIKHEIESQLFHTVYAHAQASLPVSVGQFVNAGDIVGRSGNTGNSTGYHLHFGLLWPESTGNGYPEWTYGSAVDPWVYLKGKEAPPIIDPKHKFDMLRFVRGNGQLYEVKNSDGGQERFQTHIISANEFRQSKGPNAEQFFFDSEHIYRGYDTSASAATWYLQQQPKGTTRAKWIPRFWEEGTDFVVSLWVQFYDNNCNEIAHKSGQVTDVRRFVKHHPVWTSRNGITIPNVNEILWVNGGEKYFYGEDYGLAGWERQHYDPSTPVWSAISEIHEPGQRPDNKEVRPGCMDNIVS